ncbi:MAG: YtxH domain-containing protein [Bacteroidota bacterium]
MKNKKILIGVIAGVSIGAIAILLATDRGSNARKKIMDKTSDLASSLKDCLVSFVKGGKEAVASAN